MGRFQGTFYFGNVSERSEGAKWQMKKEQLRNRKMRSVWTRILEAGEMEV
jgi:hypothetical protein